MKKSKLLVIVSLVSLLTMAIFACSNKQESSSKENVKNLTFKSFTFEDLKRELHTSEQKVVIINFWATWCPECRAEMPDLIEFYDKYKGKVKVIGLSLDESVDELKNFMQLSHVNFPIYIAGKKLVQHLMINAIPVTFLFKNGKYVKYHVGKYSYSDLKKDVDNLLKS